jgi:RNA polymerase sigma factor (sigma-70 family)
MLRVAFSELSRRRRQLRSISGPEFDDLAHQAADDALLNVLARLGEFRGLSRFTTWVYMFVMFEVSAKVARHAWRRQPPSAEELTWDRLPDPSAPRPEDRFEQRAQLDALSNAIGELTDRQREVFVAIALNDCSIDAPATRSSVSRKSATSGSPRLAKEPNLPSCTRRSPGLGAGARWALAGGAGHLQSRWRCSHRGRMDVASRPHVPRANLAGRADLDPRRGRWRHRAARLCRAPRRCCACTAAPRGVHSPSRSGNHRAATGCRNTACPGPSHGDDRSDRPRLVIEQVALGGQASGIAGQ